MIYLTISLGGPLVALLTWPVGLAAVWLLWRPASTAFFRPPGYTQAQHQAQMAEFDHEAQMAELARFRARLPRRRMSHRPTRPTRTSPVRPVPASPAPSHAPIGGPT